MVPVAERVARRFMAQLSPLRSRRDYGVGKPVSTGRHLTRSELMEYAEQAGNPRSFTIEECRTRGRAANPYLNVPPTHLRRAIEKETNPFRLQLMRLALSTWRLTTFGAGRIGGKAEDRRDYEVYLEALRDALDGHEYKEEVLGELDKGKIILFTPKKVGDRKKVMLISGMHGEEPAAPWAILKFCQENQDLLDDVAISIVPVVNLHGFTTGERNGETGAYINFFLNNDGSDRKLGVEAQILKDNEKRLGGLSKDGMLNLHEDVTAEGFYMYVFGNAKCPTVKAMMKAGKKYFDFKRDGEYEDNGKYELKGGLVDNHADGTFDDMMRQEYGIPLSVTTETPAKGGIEFNDRVAAAADMTEEFVKGVKGGKV